jgi:hypothetical protein
LRRTQRFALEEVVSIRENPKQIKAAPLSVAGFYII